MTCAHQLPSSRWFRRRHSYWRRVASRHVCSHRTLKHRNSFRSGRHTPPRVPVATVSRWLKSTTRFETCQQNRAHRSSNSHVAFTRRQVARRRPGCSATGTHARRRLLRIGSLRRLRNTATMGAGVPHRGPRSYGRRASEVKRADSDLPPFSRRPSDWMRPRPRLPRAGLPVLSRTTSSGR